MASIAEDDRGHEPAAAQGIIFASTGDAYTDITYQAAESLKRWDTRRPIVLYTDKPRPLGPFSSVEVLERPWRRSKLDAMALSPFEQTLYLDSDILVRAPLDEIFAVLDRFEFAAAQDRDINGGQEGRYWRQPLPPSFPQYNSGVVGFRKTPRVTALIDAWRGHVRDENLPYDQPVLRELLWLSEVRVATLPEAFNLVRFQQMAAWSHRDLAPRIVHAQRLHYHISRPDVPRVTEEGTLLGPGLRRMARLLDASDAHRAALLGEPSPRMTPVRFGLTRILAAAELVIGKLSAAATTAMRQVIRQLGLGREQISEEAKQERRVREEAAKNAPRPAPIARPRKEPSNADV
ncbi:MAG: hypothetical protein AAF844_13735 [Pseudomonadota bacterium]